MKSKPIEVKDYTEQPDGSALMTLELDQESIEFLVSYAVNELLRRELDRLEGEHNDQDL